MQITKTETNVLKATKRDCVVVIAWIDPQGTICTQVDTAISSFERLNITITRADRKAINTAIEGLHNS